MCHKPDLKKKKKKKKAEVVFGLSVFFSSPSSHLLLRRFRTRIVTASSPAEDDQKLARYLAISPSVFSSPPPPPDPDPGGRACADDCGSQPGASAAAPVDSDGLAFSAPSAIGIIDLISVQEVLKI